MAFNKGTDHIGATKLHVPNTTSSVLSRMVLMNFVAFGVSKILLNLVSIQNLLNANFTEMK